MTGTPVYNQSGQTVLVPALIWLTAAAHTLLQGQYIPVTECYVSGLQLATTSVCSAEVPSKACVSMKLRKPCIFSTCFLSLPLLHSAGMNLSPVARLKKTWSKVKTAKFDVLEVGTTLDFIQKYTKQVHPNLCCGIAVSEIRGTSI